MLSALLKKQWKYMKLIWGRAIIIWKAQRKSLEAFVRNTASI